MIGAYTKMGWPLAGNPVESSREALDSRIRNYPRPGEAFHHEEDHG